MDYTRKELDRAQIALELLLTCDECEGICSEFAAELSELVSEWNNHHEEEN